MSDTADDLVRQFVEANEAMNNDECASLNQPYHFNKMEAIYQKMLAYVTENPKS